MSRADSTTNGRDGSETPQTDAALAWLRESGGRGALLGEVSRQVRRRHRQRSASFLAAGLAVCVAAVYWPHVMPDPDPGLAQVQVPSATALVTAPRRQALPDGTLVELKDGAEIVADYAGVLRRVTLRRGEAHFQVAKDAARPFVVTAGTVEVRAVGTAFSVQLDRASVEVLVTEGRVAVEPAVADAIAAQEPAPVAAAYLDAGHHAVIAFAGEKPQINAMPPAVMTQRLAWRVPQLEFSRTPLREIVPLMNEHASVHGKRRLVIDPQSSGLREVKLSGFLAADNTEGLANLLRANFGVQVDVSDSAITLRQGR